LEGLLLEAVVELMAAMEVHSLEAFIIFEPSLEALALEAAAALTTAT
jgi:hypothetical protein